MSVGFDLIEVEPNGRGLDFNKWELLELWIVSVPANPGATVFARAFGQDDRLLAAAHADALMRAHRRIGAARQDVADVLQAVGHPRRITATATTLRPRGVAFDAARMKRAAGGCAHGPRLRPRRPRRQAIRPASRVARRPVADRPCARAGGGALAEILEPSGLMNAVASSPATATHTSGATENNI